MSFQFSMSSAPRNRSRTRYNTKLHLNFLGEHDVPAVDTMDSTIPITPHIPIESVVERPSTPIKRRGSMMGAMIGTTPNEKTSKTNRLLKPPSATASPATASTQVNVNSSTVLQMPIRSRRKSMQLPLPVMGPTSNSNPSYNPVVEPGVDSSISNHWTNVEKLNKELFRLFYFRPKTDEDGDLTSESLYELDDNRDKSKKDSDIIKQYVKKQKIKKLKIQEPVQQSNWVFDFFEESEYQEKRKKREKIQKLKIREPIRCSQWITSDFDLFDYQYYI